MRFEVTPAQPAGAELRRIGAALVEHAIAQVDDPGVPSDAAVHETRKAMKKLRGLLRLVRNAAPDLYKAENRAFRDAAAQLAVVRDADVAVETFDRVLARAGNSPAKSARHQADTGASRLHADAEPLELASLRAALYAYRSEAHAGAGDADSRLAQFRARMLEARERLAGWELPDTGRERDAFAPFGPGLQKTYRRGRKAMARAYRMPSVEAFHEWRKRTKYLRYHLRLLRLAWPEQLKTQGAAVKKLQTLLGEDHDLAVLEELLATFHTGDTVPAETGAERALRAEMLRQRDLLRRRARLLGELVYAERPKAFRRRIAAYWRQAERAAEADPESAGG